MDDSRNVGVVVRSLIGDVTRRQITIVLALVVGTVPARGPLAAQQPTTPPPQTPVAANTPGNTATTDARVTVRLQNVPLRSALETIARQAGLSPGYSADLHVMSMRVSLNVKNVPVADAFEQVLRGTGVAATIQPNGYVVFTRQGGTARATAVVRGRVTDATTKQPVTGVTVAIRSQKLTTLSQPDGEYEFPSVPQGSWVVDVRRLGYQPSRRTIVVNDTTTVTADFALSSTAAMLDQVVTTATGKQRKLEVGSDITVINADSVMKSAPITSVTDLLEGRVPGLTVTHTSGTPGDPSRLRLRGASSIKESNDPIVIIDGVRMYYSGDNVNGGSPAAGSVAGGMGYPRPSPLDQLDPNSIQTIEVFKGPSASAMYGSDAANGVIVITTKKGQPGATHWSTTASATTSAVPGSYPEITHSFGHLLSGGNSPLLDCPAGGFTGIGRCVVDSTITFQALNDPRYTPLTRGGGEEVSTTVSGGSPSLVYSLTGSLADTRGMTKLPDASRAQYLQFAGTDAPSWMRKPDDYRIWNFSGQVSATLSPIAHVTVNNTLSNSDQRRTSLGLSGVGALIGQFVDTTRLATSPLLSAFTQQATAETDHSTNTVSLDWQARPWLGVNTTGGIDKNHNADRTYLPAGLPEPLLGNPNDSSGAYSRNTLDATTLTFNLNTTSAIPLGGGRKLQVAVGVNAQRTTSQSTTLTTTSIPVGVTDPTSFVPGLTYVNQQSNAAATYGWYIEPQLQLSSRFFFSPGFRLDGGSGSGANAGLTGFPKMSASWLAIDRSDDPAPWHRVVSSLRLRGAFGYAGVQLSPADKLRLLNEPTIVLDGSTGQTGVVLYSQGNTKLHPERSAELEAGFDAELFDSRLTFGLTYYNKKRIDAVMSMLVAPSVGGGGGTGVFGTSMLGSQLQNIGDVRNTGLELSADAQLVQTNALQWNVNVQTSYNRVKLLTLNDGLNSSPGGLDSHLAVGYPLDGIWVRPLVGYADANHNGIIDVTELVFSDSLAYLGTQNAPFTSSLGTRLGVLNNAVSLNAMFTYESGLTQYNAMGLTMLESIANQPNATLEQQAMYVATVSASVFSPIGVGPTPYLYQTVSLLRWQSASLDMTLPTSIATLFRGQRLTMSLQGSNLWLHSNYHGKDPNVNAFTHGEGVADFGQIPEPRTWVLRFTLTN